MLGRFQGVTNLLSEKNDNIRPVASPRMCVCVLSLVAKERERASSWTPYSTAVSTCR